MDGFPFPFFLSFSPAECRAVRNGRRDAGMESGEGLFFPSSVEEGKVLVVLPAHVFSPSFPFSVAVASTLERGRIVKRAVGPLLFFSGETYLQRRPHASQTVAAVTFPSFFHRSPREK